MALEFLKEGKFFKVGALNLNALEKGILNVTGYSRYNSLSNISEAKYLEEINEIKFIFKKMINSSAELGNFIKDKKVIFNLDFDDAGKTSILICSESSGKITWYNK
jgi:hypothetical protein